MMEVNSVLFMGLWELVLLLLAVDVTVLVRFIIKRRREKASIERLVTLVRKDEERRKKETRNLLEKKYGYSDEKLEKTTKKITREEKRIYQILANLFTTRDNIAIENLSISFEDAVEPYRTLDVPKIAEESGTDGGEKGNGAEAEYLKKQNKMLSDELKITMDTISRMLHEYSNILPETGADEGSQNAVAELIINHHALEGDSQETAINDTASEVAAMAVSTAATTEEADKTVTEKSLDNSALVSMFQEEDASTEKNTAEDDAGTLATDADASVAVFDEESESGLKSEAENNISTESSLDQDIDEVLGGFDTDLSDVITEEEVEDEVVEVIADPVDELLAQTSDKTTEVEIDPVEDLISQAINQTLESHETPLPEPEEEVAEGEVATETVANDPIDELLSQVATGAVESSETAQTDAPANLSDEDIDSLLQGAVEDVSEK